MASITPIVTATLPVLERQPLTPRRVNGLPDLGQMKVQPADDAVVVDLSASTKQNESTTVDRQDAGLLFAALQSVKELAQQMKQMQSLLLRAAPGSAQAASLQQEIDNINSAYQAAITNDKVQQSLEALGSLQNSAGSITASDPHYRALLGNSLMNAVRTGGASRLATVSNSLTGLTSTDITLSASADSVLSSVDQALGSFAPTASENQAPASAKPEGELRLVSTPEIKHITFGQASDIGIGLRTLLPGDMIKAAAAHMELDLQRSIILVRPDDREQTKDWKQPDSEKDQRNENQATQVGLFYGANSPRALLSEADQPGRIVFQDGNTQVESVP